MSRTLQYACIVLIMGLCPLLSGCSRKTAALDPPPKAALSDFSAGPDVLTYHNDNARTGQNLRETILTPNTVSAASFGLLRQIPVDGNVDAEPLYVSHLSIAGSTHNLLFVATESDSVYAFDSDSYALLWKHSVLGAGEAPSDSRHCDQVVPKIGITSTPVIDRSAGPNGAIFLIAMSKDSSPPTPRYFQRLHALDLATGAELPGSPTTIEASFPGSSPNGSDRQVSFDPSRYKERSALLLANGLIYTMWASHCDVDPYKGWIIAYNESNLTQAGVLNITPNGERGAIWMSGTGPTADESGNVYFLDSNGTFDTALDNNGFPAAGDYGNAFIRLSFQSNRIIVTDYFTMSNTVDESKIDQDLGSGGALLLPDMADENGRIRHLAVGTGKDSVMYVVERDAMGKFSPSRNNVYQEIHGVLNPAYSAPAYFNNTVYYGTVDDALKSFPIQHAHVSNSPASQSAMTFTYPGVTPSISANVSSERGGPSPGQPQNGIVWVVEYSTPATLRAFDAADLKRELYNSKQAGGRDRFEHNRFVTPMIANGKVYVGTPNGVAVFGLLDKQSVAPAKSTYSPQ